MSSIDERIQQEKDRVIHELQNQPNLFLSLAENALSVAESLRDNYFQNTAQFVARLRVTLQDAAQGNRDPVFTINEVQNMNWNDLKDEIIAFIDTGIGQTQISSQTPILLRVGSYSVKVGERRLAEREQFGFYPVIFGDLEGGNKDRRDFIDIVRITAQLLGALSALERTPNLSVLMFRGPLMYLMSGYAGHTPFTESDIDLFLQQYSHNSSFAEELKEDFIREARQNIYPEMTESSRKFVEQRLFEPLAWIAYLYRKLLQKIRTQRSPTVVLGVVEKGRLREFSERIILRRIFQRLDNQGRLDYLNDIYDRTDLNSPRAFLNRLGYTDAILLSMILQPGQYSEDWSISKVANLGSGNISLPSESDQYGMDWSILKSSNAFGFPQISGHYVQVSANNQPLRVELFSDLASTQKYDATRYTYLFSSLLPGKSFPVGLDIVKDHAQIPTWMTDAYGKLIRHHLGISLQSGEVSDAEMRRLLVQAVYMTNQDWVFQRSQ